MGLVRDIALLAAPPKQSAPPRVSKAKLEKVAKELLDEVSIEYYDRERARQLAEVASGTRSKNAVGPDMANFECFRRGFMKGFSACVRELIRDGIVRL